MPLLRLLTAMLAGIVLASAALAEPATPPGDDIKAVKLDYKERRDKPGRFASMEVIVAETPLRYYVRGTNVSSPFSVQVIAASASRPLDVTLHRQNWGKPVQSGSTGRDGVFFFEGRAYGDVGVQLASPEGLPARATIVFWEGRPASPSMATVYTNPGIQAASESGSALTGSQRAGAGPGWIMYVIAGLLAVIVVFLGLMLVRRGKTGAAAILVFAGLVTGLYGPASVMAQEPGNPFATDAAPKPGETQRAEPKPGEGPNPFDVDKPPPETPRDKDKEATAGKPEDKPKDSPPANPFAGEPTTSSGRPVELKPGDFDPGNAPKDEPGAGDASGEETAAGEAPVDDAYNDRLAQAEQRIEALDRQASANRAEIERLRMLQESDRAMEPDPSNLPPMPLTCRPPAVEREDDEEMSSAWDNYDACEACYRDPFEDLDELLLNYERLRIIYMSTADFVSTAITMGDTVPKPHQFVEMSWAQQKADIQKSFQGTKDAYDAKWAEFNDEMTSILDELGVCEADHNNNPRWRVTEGEMFYRTIKASYQRTN